MLTIDKFTVESLSEDCVTDSPRPRFSYSLESDRRNVTLSRAQISVNGWTGTPWGRLRCPTAARP